MKKYLYLILLLLLTTFYGRTQSNNYYYYYQGQTTPVTLSEKVMVVKFIPGLSNSTKQQIINNAQVDLINGSYTNIQDIVQLKSRILQREVWVYPCGIPPTEGNKLSKKERETAIVQRVEPPCEGCPPPDCTPYQTWESYDNFYEALFSLLENTNVRSASKAIIVGTDKYSGTGEDFYIKIKPTFTINDLTSLLNYYSLTYADVSSTFGSNVYKISETRGGSRFCMERANIFFETGKCDYSTPNFYDFTKPRTNDPLWNDQWNLLNTGQNGGTLGADIRVVNAWQISKGNNIKVAVIDEGVQLDHRDLQSNLLPGLDVTGFNSNGGIVGGYSEIHGSSMAGIISAVSDNGLDIAGVAPLSKIIPIKAFHADWDGIYLPIVHADLARAFIWAYQQGADVINCSWGLTLGSDIVKNAITDAGNLGRGGKGCIIVGAVAEDNTATFGFPENLPSVIAVGAITGCNDRKKPTTNCDPNGTPFWEWGSNYGDKLSIVAPGIRIPTIPVYALSYLANPSTGTSPAAAQVSAVAALALSVNPNLTRVEIQKILELGSNRVGKYCYNWTSAHPNGPWNNEMGYGRLNAYNAVQLARPGVTISNPIYNVPSQTTTQVSNNLGIIFTGEACATSLPFGINFVRRHEVKTNITFPYTSNPLIICSSNGFDLANPNDGRRYAEAINITNTSATLRAYIYYGYNSLGQELGWIPTSSSNIKFTYCVVSSPTPISYEYQRSDTGNINSNNLITNIPFNLDLGEEIKINDISVVLNTGSLFPNPVRDILNIRINQFSKVDKNFQIFNALGQKQLNVSLTNTNKDSTYISINVSHLSEGIYVLKVGTKAYKFIKQ